MNKQLFEEFLQVQANAIEEIGFSAAKLHENVGQTYDSVHPYGFHLSMVADAAMKYGHEVIAEENDILPVIFAAYYHDSIEDARLSYNRVMEAALRFMSPEQAYIAAEIVYALTNDKGRTRSERAGSRYYLGIRSTPYACFVKLCDRLANMSYSFNGTNASNYHMHEVYASEWPHFIEALTVASEDSRFLLPKDMIHEIEMLF